MLDDCEACEPGIKAPFGQPVSYHIRAYPYHIISCHIDFRTKDYANAAVSQWKVKDVMTDADKGEAEIGGSEGGAHLLLFPELVCHGGHQLI
jgi:hypothetical protein